MNFENLKFLSKLAEDLESKGNFIEARTIHNLFMKEAKDKFKPSYPVEFPMNLDDALNNYDENNYEVDSEGDWEETETISDFREEASDELLHTPAAVDDNHIILQNPKDKSKFEVMNMVPEQHLDSLHNQKDKKTKFIKRAE